MSRAIFLDRDGTLNEDLGYTHKIEHFRLLDGVIEGLKKLKHFRLFIITNQSGISRGYYEEKHMHDFNSHMLEEFRHHGIKIEKVYFCPHAPEDRCDCRKPSARFVRQAEKEFGLDLRNSFTIGDHSWEINLAKNAGCKSIYLLTGHGKHHLKEARALSPDYIAADLNQAADYILFNSHEKIIKKEDLHGLIKKLRQDKKTIATLNGTFDILHKGHEKILKEAKQQADILIVAVNSDSSVKENKGPDRPINSQEKRTKMIANFRYVDYVTVFSEKTPIGLLDIIRPDVHVNGSEYGEDCIEAEVVKKHGGRIHIVKLIPGISTTELIKE